MLLGSGWMDIIAKPTCGNRVDVEKQPNAMGRCVAGSITGAAKGESQSGAHFFIFLGYYFGGAVQGAGSSIDKCKGRGVVMMPAQQRGGDAGAGPHGLKWSTLEYTV